MKVVGLVPIKTNNQRLKGKNTKNLRKSKPLMSYILNTLKKIDELEKVYVFSSDSNIKSCIPEGVDFLKRDKTLDSDQTSMNEILNSFINIVDSDVYLLAHATAPFIYESSIRKSIKKVTDQDYDSAFSVNKVNDFFCFQPNQKFYKKSGDLLEFSTSDVFTNYQLDNIQRTQDLQPLLQETSGFYIFKKDIFTKTNRRIGDNPYLCEISKVESIDIDDKEDFFIAKAIASALKK